MLDIWKATTTPGQTGPRPLVVFFHGGGFRSGDKSSVPAWLLRDCLDEGISVASANYRLSQTSAFPAPMLDGAGRSNICGTMPPSWESIPIESPRREARPAQGIALWVAFHDDLADPKSNDPVARRSSRVCCLGVDGAQTSYDPRFIKTEIGGRATSSIRPFATSTASSPTPRWIQPRIQKLFEDASPLNHVSSDDPPVILFYAEPDAPLPPDAKAGQGIHHRASARHSSPNSTHSASNAFFDTGAITRVRMIPTKKCAAR